MWGQDDYDQIRDNIFYCESAMDGVNVMNAIQDPSTFPETLKENRQRLLSEYQRAKGIETERDELLEKLKYRRVSFKKYEPPVEKFGIQRVEFKLAKIRLDTKSLFSLNWKFGKQSSWKQKGVELENLKRLKHEWIKKADVNRWIVPRAVFGLFPVQSEGDELIIYDPEQRGKELTRIRFTVCLGKGRRDKFLVSQYYHSRESGIMDVAGFAITSAGEEVDAAITRFKEEFDSESAMYLQGLSDRTAEDLMEYIHSLLRQRAGYKKGKPGQRYSPGYPALEELKNNRVIHEILNGGDIGVSLTDANQFTPPSATACIVSFHPDSSYT